MKKYFSIIALSLVAIIQQSFAVPSSPIVLTSPVIQLVDGKSFGINSTVITWMLEMRREIKKLLFGEKNGGKYLFEGKKYTIRELATLESHLEVDFYDQIKNNVAIQELELTYNRRKEELHKCLELPKQELEDKFGPFINHAQGAKDQMVMLIKESCHLRNRHDSLLPKWSQAPEGDELVFFRTQITTFQQLDEFLTDLTNFLEDLMRSCPKAWAQFEKMMAELKQNNPSK